MAPRNKTIGNDAYDADTDLKDAFLTSTGTFIVAFGLGYVCHRKGGMLSHVLGAAVVAGSEAIGKYLIDYSTSYTKKEGEDKDPFYNLKGLSTGGVYLFCGATYAVIGKISSYIGLKASSGISGFVIDVLFGAGCALAGDTLYGYVQPYAPEYLPK